MLGCRFSFEAHVKSIKKKAIKCSLITSVVLFDADEYVLT